MNFGNFSRISAKFRFDQVVLDDIRNAVRCVRAHTPKSHLADLAESKLSAIELKMSYLSQDRG